MPKSEKQQAYIAAKSQSQLKRDQEDRATAKERRAADVAAYEAMKATKPLKPPTRRP